MTMKGDDKYTAAIKTAHIIAGQDYKHKWMRFWVRYPEITRLSIGNSTFVDYRLDKIEFNFRGFRDFERFYRRATLNRPWLARKHPLGSLYRTYSNIEPTGRIHYDNANLFDFLELSLLPLGEAVFSQDKEGWYWRPENPEVELKQVHDSITKLYASTSAKLSQVRGVRNGES